MTPSTLSVYLGNGNGNFNSTPVTTSVGGPVSAGVVADFNGDGIQDVAFSYNSDQGQKFGIFLGNGNGSFTAVSPTPSVIFQSNLGPSIGTADFNSDGIADLVVLTGNVNASGLGNTNAIFLGNGDGTFTVVPGDPILLAPGAVVGDFNGDGKLDLAGSPVLGGVQIVFGNGDGTFAPLPADIGGDTIRFLLAGDFNADGKSDLLMIGVNGNLLELGSGDNTMFKSAADPHLPESTIGRELLIGDFNSDGIDDLYVMYQPASGNGNTVLLLGKGDGTFQQAGDATPLSYSVGIYTSGPYVAAADLDGDGRTDVIFSDSHALGPVTLTGQLAESSWTATATVTAISLGGAGLHLVDASYSGDNNYSASVSGTTSVSGQQLSTTTALAITAGESPVSAALSSGTVITLTATVLTGANPLTTGQVNFCDATANGCFDARLIGTAALLANGTAVYKFIPGPGQHSYKAVLLANNGAVTSYSAPVTFTVSPPVGVTYPTSTNIQYQEVSVGNYVLAATVAATGGAAPITGSVSWEDTSYANQVLATATIKASSSSMFWNVTTNLPYQGYAPEVATGDFNGDGIIDVAAWSVSGTSVAILLGKGDGTFTSTSGLPVGLNVGAVLVGDFNHDGRLDLAVSASSAISGRTPVLIFLGKGDGTFNSSTSSLTIASGGSLFAVADFNVDGKLDLLANEYDNVNILFGVGDGTFIQGPATGTTVTGYAQVLATGDLNGDGVPDLLTGGGYSVNPSQVYLGAGDGTFRPVGPALSGAITPTAATIGDLNGDGIPDLVLVPDAYVFLGKGDGTFNRGIGSLGTSAKSLAVADMNNDGKLDLVAAGSNPSLTILEGNGDGTFSQSVTDNQIPFAQQILMADLNGDGIPDLVETAQGVVATLQTVPSQAVSTYVQGISPAAPGQHKVVAHYLGDSNYNASVSSATSIYGGGAIPVFTLPSGSYPQTVAFSLTDATPGALIHYSLLSGTASIGIADPYTGPIPIYSSGTATIQAYASVAGYPDSPTVTATYTFTPVTSAPVITWATLTPITYGTALSAAQLNATASVSGTFVYSPAIGTTLNAGRYTLSVTFTPTDTTKYSTATGSVTLTVNKATPTITWATPAPIAYGTALSATQLNATASVPGTFVYSPAAGATLSAGQQTLSVTFTPTDTTNYGITTDQVILIVNGAPVITWATPAAITYGTALSATQLNATDSVAGTFVYGPAAGTTLNAGQHTLSVTFTPTDTAHYSTATSSVTLTVNKANPTITWATPAPIAHGTALSATQLNATASVPGTFAYSPAAGATLNAGQQILSVTFTPTDTANYSTATSSVTLTVNGAPAITWATPAAITYGTALSATQLNATDSVAGTFVYSPAAGTTLNAGQHTLSVTFMPTDTAHYSTATSNVTLTVNKATPVITWATPAAITYGMQLSTTQLNATASVPGTFVYSPAIGAALSAGQQTLSVTFTPTDTTNYATTTGSVTLGINKATPVITWATPTAVTYGTQLSATQLNATASVPGAFVYSPAVGATPVLGSNTLSTTFTPTDAVDYNTATGTVTLTVNAAPNPVPVISSITPGFVTAGSAAFTLTVRGTGFISGSTIYWGASALTTTYVSATQLTAQVPAGNVASSGTAAVTAQNAAPGGGTSNALQFEVDPVSPGTGPSISNATATVTAGSTATYAVTTPSSASNITVICLNLPLGASCSYSSSTGMVSIVTSSSTPKGTYQVTVVFTETLTIAVGSLLPFLLLPASMRRKRKGVGANGRIGSIVCVGLLLLGFTAAMMGCGTSSTSIKTTTTPQQVTNSNAVSLTVQ